MNNPNPFIPQGSLVEQMNKKRARFKMAMLAIFSGTILLIAPVLLIQGCKRDQSAQDNTQDNGTAVADTNNLTPTPDTGSLTASSNAAPAPNNAAVANMAPSTAPNAAANAMANNTQQPAMASVSQPVSEPAPAATTYVVVAHDTLAGIAKKFNVKLKDLEAANPGVVPTKLKVGAPLNIPASASGASASPSTMASATDSITGGDMYTVKSGDNLTKIAKSSGTTVKELMTLNNMTSTRINAGQKLKLPAKSATASPMETIPATTTTASNPTSSTSAMR